MKAVKFDINRGLSEDVSLAIFLAVGAGVHWYARSTIYDALDSAVRSAVLTAVNSSLETSDATGAR